MPRTEAANQRIRDQQCAKILDGARRAFARRGLATTMAEVATAAGVSQGLAYRYFADKDALFRALLEEGIRSSEGPSVLEMPGTPGERLDSLISALVEGRRERPELFQLLHHVLSDERTPGHLLEQVAARGRQFQETLRQLIVEGQATGEVAGDDPDQLVTAVTACLEGLSRQALTLREGGGSRFPDAEIILRMLRAPGRYGIADTNQTPDEEGAK
jgi:AcrR family transcriptional regulator